MPLRPTRPRSARGLVPARTLTLAPSAVLALTATLALGVLGPTGPLAASGASGAAATGSTTGSAAGPVGPATAAQPRAARRAPDPRTVRGLYVDTRMPAHGQGPAYQAIAKKAQALWLGSEYYPTDRVADVVAEYVGMAEAADKTPMLVVYSIPDRDCGQYSSGGLPGVEAYKKWVAEVAEGLEGSSPLLVLEPDALPFYHGGECGNADNRVRLLRWATRHLADAGAWVYIDAGHSGWTTGDPTTDDTPWDGRAELLKKAGVADARGFSTNVSNFRRTKDEHHYARWMVRELRRLGVKGTKYVVDTSRNGAKKPVDADVINPTWARLGRAPRLRFDGAFDGTLWVKHPGESDGAVNGGPGSGQWCDLLADRLLGKKEPGPGC